MESSGVLPNTQFAYRKGLGTCDALLCESHTLQSALERGQEARIVQIDFSAAFDRVNYQGILYKLCSVCIGDSVLSILTQLLSDRSQHGIKERYRRYIDQRRYIKEDIVSYSCCIEQQLYEIVRGKNLHSIV